MIRPYSPLAIVAVAIALAGCTAGAPGATDPPTPTPAQIAAANAPAPQVAAPTATATPQPVPSPTATAAPVDPTVTSTAGGDAARPPAPTPDASGMSLVYKGDHALSDTDDDSTLPLQVALTFDAGSDTGYAAEMLDLLARYGIKASFGMTGKWAEANPDLVRRMVDEGHMVFNHTWTHDSMTGASTGAAHMTREQLMEELSSTEAVIKELTGYEMKPYFRAPYGDYDAESLAWLAEASYHITLDWTCDSFGWKGWTAEQIVGYCGTQLAPNEIILMHVGVQDAAGDLQALPGLIQTFADLGYAFVTAEEMVQPDGP